MNPSNPRTIGAASRAVAMAAAVMLTAAGRADVTVTHGPCVGDVTPEGARVWVRVESAQQAPVLEVTDADGSSTSNVAVSVDRPAVDPSLVHWRVSGLSPGHTYRYEVRDGAGGAVAGHRGGFIRTASVERADHGVLAVGSCADEDEGTQAILAEVERWGPDAVLLLGDTPYIDSVDRAVQLRRHGEFMAMPALQSLVRDRPLYAMWDDHDFGLNDTDGRMKGKEVARECFLAWHDNPSAGHGDQGAYFRFNVGPMDVFVVDTRWFARTERSARVQHEWTLLGEQQWRWLEEGLRTSTARWKVIASSMVFNASVRPFKTDFWMMYPSEYRRLVGTIGAMHVSGVVLVSGDVHNSRVLRHPTTAQVGYDLMEVVSSPMHERVHDSATWSPSPWVVASYPRPNMMALLCARDDLHGAELRVRFVDAKGDVFHDDVLARVPGPLGEGGAERGAATVPWDALRDGWTGDPADRVLTQRAVADAAAWLATPAGVRECARERCDASFVHDDLEALRQWVSIDGDRIVPPSMSMWPVNGGAPVHLTGYATPECAGQAGPTEPPSPNTWWPLVARPTDLSRGEPGPARAEGMRQLKTPVAWTTDRLEGYLAEVNGSIRLQLPDGTTRCLVNDGTNERPYSSLGKLMIREGVLSPDAATLASLRAAWGQQPDRVNRLMLENARHVYWREVECESFPSSATGPVLIPFHSVAIDPAIAPPGAPAILEATIGGARRTLLVVCTDRGGAIKGPARCDLYCGIGAEAMSVAGEISGGARLWLLGPSVHGD